MKPVDKVYLQTRLRNLERKYAKVAQHAEIIDYCLEIETEIQDIKKELQS